MPMFDFSCKECGHFFEQLVRKGAKTSCPKCSSQDVEEKLAMFAVGGSRYKRVATPPSAY